MTCQRCNDNRATFLVESDCSTGGIRHQSRLLVCWRCAWASTELPGHRCRELTLCELRALDNNR